MQIKQNEMKQRIFKRRMIKANLLVFLLFGFSVSGFSTIYTNDMDYVLGDVKQAFITDAITTEAQADYLLMGFKNMGVNGIRIPIYADGVNPNETMYNYFYNKAVAEGFLIFANPAQSSGGKRIANGILNGDLTSVLDDDDATNALINRIKAFAKEYPCTWINPFNEDGRPDVSWSTEQMNTIYSSLYNNLNGAELIGPCVWGIPASIDVFNNTDISEYISIATTHNLGFDHSSWPTFIAAAEAKGLPVWDSEVNHNDAYGTGTRLEKALEYEVDGIVLYNSWAYISLTSGLISDAGKEVMSLYLKDYTDEEVGTNIALDGTATQSATSHDSPASLAIDGDTNGNWGSGSVTVAPTSDEYVYPWWQVDFGEEKTIAQIIIYNRTDACCKDNMSDFTVYVLDSDSLVVFSTTYTTYPDPSVVIELDNIQGQIVKVQQNTTNPLNLAEVEVYQKDISDAISSYSEALSDVLIYPNPAANYFAVTNSKGATIQVYSCSGKLLTTRLVKTDEEPIDISSLNSGMYLVRINQNGVISNHKIIKQ